MFTYSEKLRGECKTYFKKICDIDISDKTADMYLDSFADLYTGMENLLSDN